VHTLALELRQLEVDKMATDYRVTPELRVKFKEPFGMLIRGSFAETMDKMAEMVEREKPPKIISVGDTVSRNLYERQMNLQLSITDNKRRRKEIKPTIFAGMRIVKVINPQGTITEEAIAAVRQALEGEERVHIIVDGEEDLLTIVAVLYAPEQSFVVYGQPFEGIVVVKVTSEKKAAAEEFLKAMKTVRKAK
jgi:uncharacterized protein (UPF0218 family)